MNMKIDDLRIQAQGKQPDRVKIALSMLKKCAVMNDSLHLWAWVEYRPCGHYLEPVALQQALQKACPERTTVEDVCVLVWNFTRQILGHDSVRVRVTGDSPSHFVIECKKGRLRR